ncbi:MAG: hypothetical protein COB99_02770 [Sulfurimonas sp.]|nr:MAG: hypothetical protein COB99_02770 [Sulfurimonas sp.]
MTPLDLKYKRLELKQRKDEFKQRQKQIEQSILKNEIELWKENRKTLFLLITFLVVLVSQIIFRELNSNVITFFILLSILLIILTIRVDILIAKQYDKINLIYNVGIDRKEGRLLFYIISLTIFFICLSIMLFIFHIEPIDIADNVNKLTHSISPEMEYCCKTK